MKILVVDDEEDVKTLFEQRFRKEIKSTSLSFDFVFSGENTLQYLEEHYMTLNLVLSDINMPGMNGLELLKTIKSTYVESSLKVIMISAYSDSENRELAGSYGADSFMTKPLDFSLLREKLIHKGF